MEGVLMPRRHARTTSVRVSEALELSQSLAAPQGEVEVEDRAIVNTSIRNRACSSHTVYSSSILDSTTVQLAAWGR